MNLGEKDAVVILFEMLVTLLENQAHVRLARHTPQIRIPAIEERIIRDKDLSDTLSLFCI